MAGTQPYDRTVEPKKLLVLMREKPSKRIITISGPTHLGRALEQRWYVQNRSIPEIYHQLELSVCIEDSKISRNHAGIYRLGKEGTPEENTFCLEDLNSLNGTYLNQKKVIQPAKAKLSVGDTISLAGVLGLKVMGMREADQNNYALLVGHTGGNLKDSVRNGLEEIAEQLESRGFRGNVKTLYNKQATKKRILHELEEMAYLTTSLESHFLFYFSGHGDYGGLAVENEQRISPFELYAKLQNLRGKKAVILDCCHAGIFAEEGVIKRSWIDSYLADSADKSSSCPDYSPLPPQTLLLAASKSDQVAYCDSNPEGKKMGRFTGFLVDYLRQHPERLNLSELKEELNKFDGTEYWRLFYQGPLVRGASFTVVSMVCPTVKPPKEPFK